MNESLKTAMQEAAQLTRAGRFTEATAVIQRAMQQASGSPPAESNSSPPGQGEIIEGDLEVINETRGPAGERHPASRFIEGSFTNQAGARDYKLFVPAQQVEQQPALIVMLHGCSQNPDDFAVGTQLNRLAEEQGFVVLYPAQSLSANASGCWNWFALEHQQRDQGEPSIIADMTRQVMANYGIVKGHAFIAGLSAGGTMAATMAATYPELFSALGVHSGLPYAAAQDMVSAMTAMSQGVSAQGLEPPAARVGNMPVIVFQGDADLTVHASNAAQILTQFQPAERRIVHTHGCSQQGLEYQTARYLDASGGVQAELWMLKGAGHGWSGGSPAGSFTEPQGPDASGEMIRFFNLFR